jgi:SAM-dependent methyltransferase
VSVREKLQKLLEEPLFRPFELVLRNGRSAPVTKPQVAQLREDGAIEISNSRGEREMLATEDVTAVRVTAERVPHEISMEDRMFTGNPRQYLKVGRSAMRCIESAMQAVNMTHDKVQRVLDLPSGHGRVLRHLKNGFPKAEITACDLERVAVDYCAEKFGVRPIYSTAEVPKVPLEGKYDLIWSGSLLTHVPLKQCEEFVELFRSFAAAGGLVIFTMIGRFVRSGLVPRDGALGLDEKGIVKVLKQYDKAGAGYAPYPEQSGYGATLAHPTWVLANLCKAEDLKLVMYHEQGWADRQDAICLQKK